jgi:hypothetical protein
MQRACKRPWRLREQFVSVQPKHAVDGAHFGGLDEFGMRNGDCEAPGNSETYRSPASKGAKASKRLSDELPALQ